MTRLPRVTANEMISALKRAGWMEVKQRGSHVQMKHPLRLGKVTVPKHARVVLMPKLVASILDQAGLSTDEFIALL